MIYEWRTYYIYPGKMEAIHKRFAEVTLPIFKRMGMEVTEFWEDLDPDKHALHYVMVFANRQERDAKFEQLRADAQWIQAKADSEQEGPIVERMESVFLQRVPYFPGN